MAPASSSSNLKGMFITPAGVFIMKEDDTTTTFLTHTAFAEIVEERGARYMQSVTNKSTHVVLGDTSRLQKWKGSQIYQQLQKENAKRKGSDDDDDNDEENDNKKKTKKVKTTNNAELVAEVPFDEFLDSYPGLREAAEAKKEVVCFTGLEDKKGNKVPIPTPEKRTQKVIRRFYKKTRD